LKQSRISKTIYCNKFLAGTFLRNKIKNRKILSSNVKESCFQLLG
jgi:hypothetical protein